MAIYPLLQDNTTWLLAADFDEENWQNDVSAFRQCAIEAVSYTHLDVYKRQIQQTEQ